MNNKEQLLHTMDLQYNAVKLVHGETSDIAITMVMLRKLIDGFSDKIELPEFKYMVIHDPFVCDAIFKWRVCDVYGIIVQRNINTPNDIFISVFMLDDDGNLKTDRVQMSVDDIPNIETFIIDALNKLKTKIGIDSE